MGLEGYAIAALIVFLAKLIAVAAGVSVLVGLVRIIFGKENGLSFIFPGAAILFVFFAFWLFFQPQKHTVLIDLSKPLEKQGVPPGAHWLKQHDYYLGDYWMCEVNGKVSLTVILPDGKKIEEKVNDFMANYGTNGFYDIQIDNYQTMNSDQAIARIHAEAQKWAVGAKNKDKVFQEEQDVKDWIMGNPRNGQSYYAGIYCEEEKYVMFSQAMHNSFHLDQFIWRYQITMAWEFDARAKQFHK
ncbi:MAG TPA: hypothetical protein VK810_06385 [Dongiaceae bacterium]|jgi:hypothetical protein|nr:hypothetical protein [Dongiaceae bacterium]